MSLKLTKPQGHALFVMLTCLFMSCGISIALTFVKLGFHERFVSEWTKSWAISFLVSVPIAFVAVPVARRIADSVTR